MSKIPEHEAGPAGRMVAIKHAGPLPWVQLRNAAFSTSIFRKMVGRCAPGVPNGGLVSVYDRDGAAFGTALFSSQSQIALRMVAWGDQPLDETFLEQRLEDAVRLRREILKLDQTTDAYRVVHAEGDGLPGLIADRLGKVVVVELISIGMYQRRERITEKLKKLLPVEHVLFRADEMVQNAEGFRLDDSDAGVGSGIITENKLRFQVDPARGHKTGFFCDQRDNRMALTQFTTGAQVLDMCCYSGGFGIYAAKLGEAANVTAVDLDEDAVALARRNANLNQIAPAKYQTVHADGFGYLRQMKLNGRAFDVVVLDPPKLISSRDEMSEGRKKYFDLNKLALGIVKPGGMLLTCSCSGLLDPAEMLNVVRGAARSAGKRVQILKTSGAGADHPVATDYLEGMYLKCVWCRVV
ncbi:MAG TPA: class I SAM-dependent rRNA methyltransferase [Phycisphaerae bacterium]|nr:class I SAM-dependent rRNA methyltransferase [Phycisphaerae bacterium]